MAKNNWRCVYHACCLSVACLPSFAADIYPSELESAYDGDTITVWALVQDDIKRKYKVRVIGVDTPEIRGKCQKEKDLAIEARQFTINTLIARQFEIDLTGGMTFSRHLARIYVDGVDLADLIIAAGFGRENHGERRSGWC